MNARMPHHALLIEATLVATIGAATLALPAAGAGVVTSATGSGQTTVAGELRTFSFVAVLRPDGVATGMAQVNNRSVGEMFQLSVDCLKSSGRSRSSVACSPATPIPTRSG